MLPAPPPLLRMIALLTSASVVLAFHPAILTTPTATMSCSRTTHFQAHGKAGPETTVPAVGDMSSPDLQSAASKFKVVTCMSTSCSNKRKNLGMDSLSTFAAFYSRSTGNGNAPAINVEEGPCLGACKEAPCVAVEHADFVGSVSLEGMTDNEFADRVFHNIITEDDADRVWSSVTNAVKIMAEEESGEL